MENIRLAGKMRKYINSSLRRSEAIGLSPHLSVNTPVLGAEGEQILDIQGSPVVEKVVVTVMLLNICNIKLNVYASGCHVRD